MYLTEKSGILDRLLLGNQILADCGFNIQESVGHYCESKSHVIYKG